MNWRGVIVATVVTVPVVALLGYGMTKDPKAIPSPLPGKPAPAFALPALNPPPPGGTAADRDTVRLKDLRGQVVVLNFYASWCIACRDEHVALSEAASLYHGKPVHFYGVVYNDTPAGISKYIQDMGGQTYPTLLDPGDQTAIDYGLYGVPETFFIGPNGRVAYKQVGPASVALVREKVDSLLATVHTATTSPLERGS